MKKPRARIARGGKRTKLAEWLERTRPGRIGESEFAGIAAALAPISESYLRKLLRDSGVPLEPVVGGVRQSNLNELESSLVALLDEYESGDAARRQAIRKLVITAKDHARFAARRNREKLEMILWMTTWLENPPLFRTWVRLRIHALAEPR
jgi:hypothetical protein